MAGEVFSSSRTVWIIIAVLVILAILVALWINSGAGG
jgi:hypothetical protein